MNQEVIEYLLLIFILIILLFTYFGYVIYDNHKKFAYYKQQYPYETDWDKYSHMVKLQRRLIKKKKLELSYLKFLIFMKGLNK